MWTASNRHVVPSTQETIGIKEVISQLERELASERELLKHTQVRIADLEVKLAQEKASILPVRRLPFDILSEIFRICCIEERLAPVVIAAVCYRWRQTIIDTPLARSQIFPQNNPQYFLPNDYVSLFLERSIPCLLHLSVPWPHRACVSTGNASKSTDYTKCDCVNVRTIFEHTHRIQCLSAQLVWMSEYSTVPFENLTRLTIIWDGYTSIKKTVSLLDGSLFPKLYCLDLSCSPQVNSLVNIFQVSGTHLKHLSMSPDREGYWLVLVQLCASTLTTLVVGGGFVPSRKRVIEFPELKSLIVTPSASTVRLEAPVLEVVAPNLAFYQIGSKVGSSEIVHDNKIHRVTHLHTRRIPCLPDYPLLRTLHVPNSLNVVDGILVQLEQDMNVCSGLQRIELFTTSDAFDEAWKAHPGGRRLAKRNIKAGSDTKFIFNSKSPNSAPGYYHPVSPSFTDMLSLVCLRNAKCTEDMACRTNL
jgi:hypothetical protein